MTYPKIVGASALALALVVPVALSPMLASPAHAQFGFGRIVYDPTNYAQNLLTAARTLEQINNLLGKAGKGRGQVMLGLKIEEPGVPSLEADIKLPAGYAINPTIRHQIRVLPGVIEVYDI